MATTDTTLSADTWTVAVAASSGTGLITNHTGDQLRFAFAGSTPTVQGHFLEPGDSANFNVGTEALYVKSTNGGRISVTIDA